VWDRKRQSSYGLPRVSIFLLPHSTHTPPSHPRSPRRLRLVRYHTTEQITFPRIPQFPGSGQVIRLYQIHTLPPLVPQAPAEPRPLPQLNSVSWLSPMAGAVSCLVLQGAHTVSPSCWLPCELQFSLACGLLQLHPREAKALSPSPPNHLSHSTATCQQCGWCLTSGRYFPLRTNIMTWADTVGIFHDTFRYPLSHFCFSCDVGPLFRVLPGLPAG
jgi:hypothetical protein